MNFSNRAPHLAPSSRVFRRVAGVAAVAVATLGSSMPTATATPVPTPPSSPYVPMRVHPPDAVPLRWGERLVAASLPGPLGGNPVTNGDLDGDGVKDFWTAAPFQPIGGNPSQGRVFAVSGKTMQVIYRIDAPVVVPADAAAFGFYISSPGDVNGDGIPDLVAGTDAQNVTVNAGLGGCVSPAAPEPNGCNENQGMAWVFSGVNGSLLYTLNNPTPQGNTTGGGSARFGSRIGRAGDINGDAVPDIIVGASNQDVCDTAACSAAVATATGTAGTQANAGNLACSDITPVPNGCARNQGQAFIFSGTNGALLRTLDLPAADQVANAGASCLVNCGNLGLAVQSPGNLNGGAPDQQVDASNLTVGGNVGQGRVYLFDGDTGNLLARVDDPVPQAGATFGFQDAAPNSPGDINNDGVPDIYANGFGQDVGASTGQGRAWIFDGAATVAAGTGVLLVTVDDPSPEFGGQFGWSMTTTDIDNNGKADFYVGQSPHHVAGATGSGGTYVFNGPASAAAGTGVVAKLLELPLFDLQTSTPSNLGPNLGWGLAAPGDLDGDGRADYLAGAPFEDVKGVVNAGQILAFESRERPPVANFDGNTTTDVSVFRASDASWFIQGGTSQFWGAANDVPVRGDYDGDGVTDLATFRSGTGQWFINNSSAPDVTTTWGVSGDIPVPGDYDGDGTTDVAVFRNGLWFIQGQGGTAFGQAGDIPVPGDYNGDGKTDIAVFRAGLWYIQGQAGAAWGQAGDIPVPADYDGNGTTDIAVFRAGLWFIMGQPGAAWGQAGDVPVPGDYNGDGKYDIAVYRPGTAAAWYILGQGGTFWGTTGDQPLPLPNAIYRFFF